MASHVVWPGGWADGMVGDEVVGLESTGLQSSGSWIADMI